ncbi:MAG: hypothetical protein U0Q12_09355 [Vicinamibacterales bacterium]
MTQKPESVDSTRVATPFSRRLRRVTWLVGLWLVSLIGVWGWMRWEARSADQALARVELRARFAETEASVLRATVQLAGTNFGDAGASAGDALRRLADVRARFEAAGLDAPLATLADLQTQLERARQLAAQLDQRAAEPLQAAAELIGRARIEGAAVLGASK